MKKLLSITIALIMAFSVCTMAFAKDYTLKFNENGKFTIMVLADIQEGYPVQEATIEYINEALDKVNPDVVVLLGDNLYENNIKILDEICAPMEEHGIPFTFVFGNHDRESAKMEKEDQLAYYKSNFKTCIAYDADISLHGCATHNLPVYSSDRSKVAFNMWMFDCGDYVTNDDGSSYYDCVRKDQINWYETVSKKLESDNGGKVPSIAFQHTIVGDAADYLYPIKTSFRLDDLTVTANNGTNYLVIPNASAYEGCLYETICPSEDNDGQWDAMVSRGDVMALLTGHDHVNEFKLTMKGIDLLQTPTCGFNSYHNYGNMGARVITVDENKPFEYEQYMLYACDLASESGSKLNDSNGASGADFFFGKVGSVICYGFSSICSLLFGWITNLFVER